MENNGMNPNTGSKGVFPGTQVAQNQTGQPVQNTQTAPQPEFKPEQPEQPNPQPQATQPAEDAKTYMRLETKNSEGQTSGILEIDLISFRERGQESRYLSINTVGAGQDGGQSDTTISIDNEQDFNKFKEFIANLNWND